MDNQILVCFVILGFLTEDRYIAHNVSKTPYPADTNATKNWVNFTTNTRRPSGELTGNPVKTAWEHAEMMIKKTGIKAELITPESFISRSIPDIPEDYTYICCPRSISNLSTKIGLGYIGPKMRSIIKNSFFLILIPYATYKEWKSIPFFFSSSNNSVKALW